MSPQVAGVARIIITALLSGMVAKGVISQEQAGSIAELAIGTVGIMAMAAWSWISNRLSTMIGHVAASPKVVEVKLTSQATADSIPNEKVTGPQQ